MLEDLDCFAEVEFLFHDGGAVDLDAGEGELLLFRTQELGMLSMSYCQLWKKWHGIKLRRDFARRIGRLGLRIRCRIRGIIMGGCVLLLLRVDLVGWRFQECLYTSESFV